MFTGIVEELGSVVGIDRREGFARLTIRGPLVVGDAGHGDSIAVNGVCLTVVTWDDETFAVDVMGETLDRSSIGGLAVGSPVNLERAMAADGRFGGHVVQGHVDGTGRILSRDMRDDWEVVRVSLPGGLHRYVVEKGSITIDGISLTVSAVGGEAAGSPWLEVSLIPTTRALTTLGSAPVGTVVNLEVDVLAKYVERLLATRGDAVAGSGPTATG